MAQNGKTNEIKFKLMFEAGDKNAFNGLKKDLQELRKLASSIDVEMDGQSTQQVIGSINKIEEAMTKAFNPRFNVINIQKFNNILAKSNLNLKNIQSSFAVLGSQGQAAFLKMTSQLLQMNSAIKQTNKFVDSISTTLFNTVKQTVTSSLIQNISGSVQKAYYYVKDLDRALNDIRIVTGKSSEEMADFAIEANNAAKALAVTTEDYTKGALIYFQQGLDKDTVTTLTDITAKTSNVTGQAMSTVSEELTAVQNGYQVANQAAEEGMQVYEEYVDKMAAVGASTASDLQELSTAMSKVASAASAMGVDFDDLNAQIATIVSVTRQAPESVGTALKTIYARLGDLKVDGVDEFGTKLGDVTAQLQTMGINILDQQGNMRKMTDVMAEVAEKQDTWTSAQRQAAAVAMAGKRQYNNLIALFDNWDMYGEALETSMNAAGTLERQQEIAIQSLANKMDILKATAEDLYDSLFDTSTIGNFIDTGTGLLKLITEFTDGVGGLNNIVPLLLSSLSQLLSSKMAAAAESLYTNLTNTARAEEMAIQNASQLRLMFSDSSLQGAEASQGQVGLAFQESLQQMQMFYNQMQQYQGLMTQEEQEQYRLILEEISKIGEKNVKIAETAHILQSLHNNYGLIGEDIFKDLKDTEAQTQEVQKIDGLIKTLSENLDVINNTKKSSNQRLIDVGKTFDPMTLDEYMDKLREMHQLTEEEAEGLRKALDGKAGEPLKKRLTEIIEALKATGENAREIQKLSSEMDSANTSVEALGNNLLKVLDTRSTIQNFVSLASAIGQVSMSLQTLGNIYNTIFDENLDVGEKFLRVLMNIGFVAPSLVSGFSKLTDGLLKYNDAAGLRLILEEQKTAIENRNNAIAAKNEAIQKRSLAQQKLAIAQARLLRKEEALKTAEKYKEIAVQRVAQAEQNKEILINEKLRTQQELKNARDRKAYAQKKLDLLIDKQVILAKELHTDRTKLNTIADKENTEAKELKAQIEAKELEMQRLYAKQIAQNNKLVTEETNVENLQKAVKEKNIAITEADTAIEQANTFSKEASANASHQQALAERYQREATKASTAVTEADTAVTQADTVVTEENTIVEGANANAKYAEIMATKGNIKEKIKETQTVLTNSEMYDANTLAIAKNAAAKAAAALAAAAVIAITILVIKHIEKEREALHKENEEEIEKIKKAQELVDANNELIDSYNKLIRTFQNLTEDSEDYKSIQQQLHDNALELVEAYNIQNGALLVMAERYDEVAKAAQKAQEKELENDIIETQKSANAIANNAALDTAKGFDSSMTVGNQFGSSFAFSLSQKDQTEDAKKASEVINNLQKDNEHVTQQNDVGRSLTFTGFEANNAKDMYEYMQMIEETMEALREEGLTNTQIYKNLRKEYQDFAESMPELEAQLDRIEEDKVRIIASGLDTSKIYNEDSIVQLEELDHQINVLRNKLIKEDIPEDKIDKYIEDILVKYNGFSKSTMEIIDATNQYVGTHLLEDSFKGSEKDFRKYKKQYEQQIYDIFSELNDSQLAFVIPHLDTIPLNEELDKQILEHQPVLNYYTSQGVSSSLSSALTEYDAKKKGGFDQGAIDTLFANEDTAAKIGSQTEFEYMDMAQQLDAVTNAYIRNKEESEAARQAAEDLLRVEVDEADKAYELQLDENQSLLSALKDNVNGIEELEGQSQKFFDALAKLGKVGSIEKLNEEEQKLINTYIEGSDYRQKTIIETAKEYAEGDKLQKNYNQLNSDLQSLIAETQDYAHNIELLNEVTKNHNTVLDSIQSNYKDLMTMIDDFNETGHQTIDNVQKLLEMDDKYIATLRIENDSISINETAFQQMALAKLNDLKVTALNTYEQELLRISELDTAAAALEAGYAAIVAAQDFDTMSESARNSTNRLLELAAAYRASMGAMSEEQTILINQQDVILNNKLRAIDNAIEATLQGGAGMRSAMGVNKKSGKSGGSKKDKDKDTKEQEDEYDRYWSIKKAIDAVDHSIKQLEKDQANLHGRELINSLNQENLLIAQQTANYEQLYEMQKKEAEELRQKLSPSGVNFDGNGAITNYAAATSQAMVTYANAINQYNAGQLDEEGLKPYEKAYENFKKALDRYDKLYYSEMVDTQDKIDDNMRQQVANNLKGQETNIQLRLDTTKALRDQYDFMKDIEQDFRKVNSDLMIDVKYNRASFDTFVRDLDVTIGSINEVETEINKMANGGTSVMFDSISQAQEKLKELNEQLLEQGKSLHDLYKEIQQSYIDGIDQVKDNFDELMKRYDHFTNTLDYHRELIELIYGDKAFDLMDKYYTAQNKNLDAQIDSVKQQANMWQSEFEKSYELARKTNAKVNKEDFTTQTEDMKKAYENMIDSQEKLNELITQAVKLLQDKYLNTINKIMDTMDKNIQGRNGFEGMKDNWEFMQKMAEEYLDDVEGAGKIQIFANRMDMDKANASNLKTQQKIQAFRDKEIKTLREKENLTQADLDLAEARYELMLKEAALEDAQNNKTSMKLTRNEQGNQSYQYIADEEDVGQKQQDLLQSYVDLYKLADDSYNHAMELATSLYEEYVDKIRTLYEDTTLSEEERNQKIMELQEQYLPQIEAAVANSELYKQEAMIASAGVFALVCEQDAAAYQTLTDKQKRLVDEVKTKNFEDYDALRTAIIDGYYPDLNKKAEGVFHDLNVNSQTTAANVIGYQATNEDSLKNEIVKATNEMQEAIKQYETELDTLQEIASIDFGNVQNEIDTVERKIEEMDGVTDQMVINSSGILDQLRQAVDAVSQAYNGLIGKIIDAHNRMVDLAKIAQLTSSIMPSITGDDNKVPDIEIPDKIDKDSGSGDSSGNYNTHGDSKIGYQISQILKKTASKAGYTAIGTFTNKTSLEDFVVDSLKTVGSTTNDINQFLAKKNVQKIIEKYAKIINTSPMSTSDYIKDFQNELARDLGFASGGYTGTWNDTSGRLAFLHQKELVLNKDDTANFLSGINMIRDMTSLNGSISNAITNAVANMVLTLSGVRAGANSGSVPVQTSTSADTYNITAEFPNANDVNEIREAILSLPNLASQYKMQNGR